MRKHNLATSKQVPFFYAFCSAGLMLSRTFHFYIYLLYSLKRMEVSCCNCLFDANLIHSVFFCRHSTSCSTDIYIEIQKIPLQVLPKFMIPLKGSHFELFDPIHGPVGSCLQFIRFVGIMLLSSGTIEGPKPRRQPN